ncbi:unnamed protein product [Oikopleura dioica]|uniref:Reverse transcriptase domain-containing protein n=1 Tax=Oikopleura dioica TaxID=34765 RepID=E4YBK9_OIKDI|nr:unnamed protein product [Oikopleura dioica]
MGKKLNRFPYSVNGENRHPAILKKFNGLKSNTKGWSGVNKFFLDSLPLAMLELLVINPVADCLDSGIYPEILRYSRVVILPKKARGIRPLAISECLNSVLEKVIISTLNSFIEGIKGLPDQQSGFRSSRSCGTALFEIIKTYEESRAREDVLAVIFLDARNAFGSLSHKSLMVVLREYFEGGALKILEESLLRLFVVNNRGFYSSIKRGTPHGVPQGGTLSPALFCLYISQIANLSFLDESKKLILFADDTCISIAARNYGELVKKGNEAIALLEEALTQLGLCLVPSKTNILTFGKSKMYNFGLNCIFKMSGSEIKPVKKAKYLGTTIEAKKGELSFESNTKILFSNFRTINCKVSCVSHSLSLDSNATILRACAIGTFQHNLAVLPPLSNVDTVRLQKIYNRGLDIPRGRRFNKVKKGCKLNNRLKRMGMSLHSYDYITKMLTTLGQQSLNSVKLRSTICNIQAVFTTGKSAGQSDFLCKNIVLYDKNLEHKLIEGIPNLFQIENELTLRKGLLDIHSSENCFVVTSIITDALFAGICLQELILRECIDFRIRPELSFKNKSATKNLWPLFAAGWIDEMPRDKRKFILLKKGGPILKKFFKSIPVHLEQSTYCIDCRPPYNGRKANVELNTIINDIVNCSKEKTKSLLGKLDVRTINEVGDTFSNWNSGNEGEIDIKTLIMYLVSQINEGQRSMSI